MPDPTDFGALLESVAGHLAERDAALNALPVTPTPDAVRAAVAALPAGLPDTGLGTAATLAYLQNTLLPGCLTAQNGPRYFGFVTGGVTPAAQLADMLGSGYDENVQVTLPDTSAATAVESRTLELVLDLLQIPRETFDGRTITTGATGSNILGMACARDYLYANSPHLPSSYNYAQEGPPSAADFPGLPSPPIVILSLHPHFSVLKAAALVGLGAGPRVVQPLNSDENDDLTVDLENLEARLQQEKGVGRGVIVSYGLGEVNTGAFGSGLREIAALCKQYGAWLHVDAAFGGFAGVVPEMRHLVAGMDLADSLTLDGHKWLNVPYDCGIFFTRSKTALPSLLGPAASNTPAYLSASSASAPPAADGGVDHALVPSPLYVNIENSRRFRALPLFASLMSLGREGYADIIRRNCAFARRVAAYIHGHPGYELLNAVGDAEGDAIIPLNIVLFSGAPGSRFPLHKDGSSARLTAAINATRRMYVTGTRWDGVGAVRLAVSNWRTTDADWEVVKEVLDQVAREG